MINMRNVALCAAFAAAIVAVASASSCGAKCQARTQRMASLRDRDGGVIAMNSGDYSELLRTAPRNYTTILMLNAINPQRRCQQCRVAHKEYKILASSFYREFPDNEDVFFVELDFDGPGNPDVFQKLQTQSAPVFFVVPSQGKPVRNSQPMAAAEEMMTYVSGIVGTKFPIVRPVDYTKVVFNLLVVAVVVVGLFVGRAFVMPIISQPRIWAVFAMGFSMLMMSGHMWLQIRGAPYAVTGQNGQPVYMAGTSSYMYGAESHIIFALYAVTAAGIVLLNDTSLIKGKGRVFTSFLGLALLALGFSMLYKFFREKYGGYPYRLFF